MRQSIWPLTAVLCCSLFSFNLCQAQDIWQPYFELEGRGGSMRDVAQGNLFLPLMQDDSQLLFTDLRLCS